MLELQHVSRHFGGLLALEDVNMVVEKGKIVGLIGPNGAGKTTMINNISGLDHPTTGIIGFDGKQIQKQHPHIITRMGISRTYQNIRLFGDMTAHQNLLIGQHTRGKASLFGALTFLPSYRREEKVLYERANMLLDRFGLSHVADTLAGTLSYGDQRRLEMARALSSDPKLLLLDEPTAGMNPTETRELGEQILRLREDGKTVLVIEHDMSLIHQVCDEVYVLNFGRMIANGTPAEIREDPVVIEAYLGADDSNRPAFST